MLVLTVTAFDADFARVIGAGFDAAYGFLRQG